MRRCPSRGLLDHTHDGAAGTHRGVLARWRPLETPQAMRGGAAAGLGEAWIDTIEVVTGLFKDKAVDLAAAAVTKKIDGQVDPGVYSLSPDALPELKGNGNKLAKMPAAADGGPILVLVHGTFVDTSSTFGKLWAHHPGRGAGAVHALRRPGLCARSPDPWASPFANALTLAETLPKGARLHFVTHSRGGLVAEVLAPRRRRAGTARPRISRCSTATTTASIAPTSKSWPSSPRQQALRVERMVRVACSGRAARCSRRAGSMPTCRCFNGASSLPAFRWLPELVDFLSEVARRRTDPAELPGLEAMMPGRPVRSVAQRCWRAGAGRPARGRRRHRR